MKEHCEIFKKKYKNTYEKDGRLYAKAEREFTDAESYIKTLLKDDWFKGKIKSAEAKKIQ